MHLTLGPRGAAIHHQADRTIGGSERRRPGFVAGCGRTFAR
ncbi:hypothetical protein A7982_12093 [Minicystis rosea]|nr:hypothetical protein A7982_12093 [Minicystis rosea]